MRIGQYSAEDSEEPWVGVRLDEETVVNLQEAGVGIPRTTTELLAGWKWQKKAELAVEDARETGTGLYDTSDLERHAPVTDPRRSSAWA